MDISSRSGRRGESEAETSEPVCMWLRTARGKGGMIMPIVATAEQRQISHARQAARRELVRSVQEGMTPREARRRCPVRMHRTTVYRLLKCVKREGEQALTERRHGHTTKLREDILTWVLDYCQSHPSASSAEVQRLLAERFALSVSVSQREARASRSWLESPIGATRKKSRKPALQSRQATMNKQVDCCWQQRPQRRHGHRVPRQSTC
jgi:transposase